MLHRNSQKRIYFPDAVYFVTIVVQDRIPFFEEDIFCELFVEDLRFCKKLKVFYLYGFVILYDHIHLLIQPGEKYNISEILHNLKRTSSLHINEMIKSPEGEDIYPRLRVGKSKTRQSRLRGNDDLIKEIKNFDGKMGTFKNQFVQKYGQNQFQFPKFQWQKSFFDHYIRNDNDLNYHLEYIWRNPEKHGITNNFEKYRYSSYNNYQDLIDYFD